jgi:hypothetical protein
MPKQYDPAWENALTVVQEVQPPFIPHNAHAMTVTITYPPGSARRAAAPAPEWSGFRLHARRRDAVRTRG